MTTVISYSSSSGERRRCDATCHNAHNDKCVCICGGKNHGGGLARAIENTERLAEAWMEKVDKEHPDRQHKWKVFNKKIVLVEGDQELTKLRAFQGTFLDQLLREQEKAGA